jgi:Notch-like protein
VSQGADLNARTDNDGETPLHLAARYALADAAKALLEEGADPNAQDNNGRTPLHSAVAADAQGVFNILLKNRATDLNARQYDGLTPLILAVRMAIEGVVEQLIEAEVEINLADESGKTALHWAAAVNNVSAVSILLRNNANRDATDTMEQTPLFLAAKEGSYQSAKALLDHGANRDIQDHMDRLPIHIAQEKMQREIVQLLTEHTPPQTIVPALHHHQLMHQQQIHQAAQAQANFGGSPPHNSMQTGGLGAKPKQKRRATSKQAGGVASPESTNEGATLPRQRKPSVKRKKLDSSGNELLSPEGSPYNEANFGATNTLAASHPNLEELRVATSLPGSKQPPSYETAMVSNAMVRNLQAGMPGQQGLESQYTNFGGQISGNGQQQQQHPRQQSMPVAISNNGGPVGGYATHFSPPHSNSSAVVHSPPPHQQQQLMSPPQSIQSSNVSSPPAAASSPLKARSMQLPTSPTHMAAMRGATMQHQRGQNFDFPQQQQHYGNAQFQYPTPPHNGMGQQGQHDPASGNFPTPSPDSPATPGQWSSASPQSHSDWSEGVHSPPSTMLAQQQQQQMTAQHQHHLMQRQNEPGVLI